MSEISKDIVTSKIEITKDDALGKSEIDTEIINRKIFLLSCSEVGIQDSINMPKEGKMLKYFKKSENRKVYIDGKDSSWWLRTPNTYYLSCTYVIGANNKIGTTNAYDKNGVRPAFCCIKLFLYILFFSPFNHIHHHVHNYC